MRKLTVPLCFTLGLIGVLFYGRFAIANADNANSTAKDVEPKRQVRPDLPRSITDNTKYLADLIAVRQEFIRLPSDNPWHSQVASLLATFESCVGRYRRAMAAIEPLPTISNNSLPQRNDYDGKHFDELEACDAVETILEFADERQVIMINEAHHVPMHRAFTIQLLERLYKKGYRYFAAEALSHLDDALQVRGFPTFKTGHYLCEPVCAELVRTALRLGYQVVPYEFIPTAMPKPESNPLAIFQDRKRVIELQNAREEGQARNLVERILAMDPKAKLIVHAGYGHIQKTSMKLDESAADDEPEMAMMGFFFRKITGIDPLCIDQNQRSERDSSAEESPEFRYVIDRNQVKDTPVIFRHKASREMFPSLGFLDMVVFHPRSRFENGRPTWLAMGGMRKPHLIMTEKFPEPGSSFLAQAFYSNEIGTDTIPVDQMEYDSNETAPTLWLPAGEFRIRVIESSGKILHAYSISN